MSKNRIINKTEAAKIISGLSDEFLIVHNPSFIHPQIELYPITPAVKTPIKELTAIVMDMDGTTTTTEELCLHSLEFMIRKISGRMNKQLWKGLDHTIDYPHIIGNSTTKHVEYLVKTYKKILKPDELHKSFMYASLWTIFIGQDEARKKEVRRNLSAFGLENILNDKSLSSSILNKNDLHILSERLFKKYKTLFHFKNDNEIVRASIDIYYQRYHEILAAISNENFSLAAVGLPGDSSKPFIEPMPGVAFFLCLVKGLLGDEMKSVTKNLFDSYLIKQKNETLNDIKINNSLNDLLRLSIIFEKKPLKVAVVTSSIYYEANIVMTEVFKVLRKEISYWIISAHRKKKLLNIFSDYRNIYDTFITASDANEIRLKPHRDLYSIALHQLNIPKKDFNKIIGFEDSESGCFAIRAAGIGMCVAVPFAQTSGHNFEAATYIAKKGLPEILIKKNLFLKRK